MMRLSAKTRISLPNHYRSEAEHGIWGSNQVIVAAHSKSRKCQPLYPINAEAENDARQQTLQRVLIFLLRINSTMMGTP